MLLAQEIHTLLTNAIWLHVDLDVPFRKSNLRSITICAELLKVCMNF